MAEGYGEENQPDQKVARFNSSIACLMRLDGLWKDANNHSRSGDLLKWKLDLDRIFLELSEDSKEEDHKRFRDLCIKCNEVKNQKAEFYYALFEIELFLRRLMNKTGKGTAYVDEDEDDME